MKTYQLLGALLVVVWFVMFSEVTLLKVINKLPKLGELGFTAESEENAQVFTAVGFSGDQSTKLAIQILDKLKAEAQEKIFIYTWAAPKRKEFLEWLETRKDAGQVPSAQVHAPVVFNRVQNRRVFLGGVGELIKYVRQRFPSLDFTDEAIQYAEMEKATEALLAKEERQQQKRKQNLERPHQEKLTMAPQRQVQKEEEEVQEVTVVPHSIYANDPVNAFPPQVVLKRNKLYTTYRLAEGKTVTNHRPILQALKKQGWGYMISAPLLASWIVVQDQTTAAAALKKYRKAIINNIGYGGQSCFGGTKGKQLSCRQALAQENGCEYDDLGIQPAQYRLWVRDECTRFFENVCSSSIANRLWMEKPSGGQHGAGMNVRDGCDEVRKLHPDCASEENKKKFIIMPYLDPALLSGHKFDLRTFMLIASMDPELVFYHDGFARKASSVYSNDVKDRNAHITNAESQSSRDHFYSLARVGEELHRESGFPKDYMTRVFREHAIKVEKYVYHVSRSQIVRRKGVYQIFALDWIIDSNGGIHMLEANSNPLVTVYEDLKEEYTETWDSMTDLVLKVQTDPSALLSDEHPRLITEPKRYEYRGWHLFFNELEERHTGKTYKPCESKITQFDLAAFKQDKNYKYDNGISEDQVQAHQSNVIDTHVEKTVPNKPSPSPGQTNEKETPYTVSSSEVQAAIAHASKRPCTTMDPFELFEGCSEIDRDMPNEVAVRCDFTNDGGHLYIFEPKQEGSCFPTVMITAGMHGNEQAGIVAARHMRKKWPAHTVRLVIVERLNVHGAERRGRYIPKISNKEHDLNRNFPPSGLIGDLAHKIWAMVEKIKPHIFVDMHEGWGVYGKLRANYVKGGPLVGNPKFSKGSSVIASPSALPLAKIMANKVNEITVSDHSKDFLAIVPPIETGLANMVMREFDAPVIVIETTSGNQQLQLRGRQQLLLVGTYLQLFGALPADFDPRAGFEDNDACLAGSANCLLRHPDDVLVERQSKDGNDVLQDEGEEDEQEQQQQEEQEVGELDDTLNNEGDQFQEDQLQVDGTGELELED